MLVCFLVYVYVIRMGLEYCICEYSHKEAINWDMTHFCPMPCQKAGSFRSPIQLISDLPREQKHLLNQVSKGSMDSVNLRSKNTEAMQVMPETRLR